MSTPVQSEKQRQTSVDGWDKAKPAAFDVTVTSPLTPVTLNEASIHEGAVVLAAKTRKHAANDARCQALADPMTKLT